MSTRPQKIVVTAEQLRRPVPGGIGTYLRGLHSGLSQLGVNVSMWQGNTLFPVQVMTKLWDVGFLKPPHDSDLVHATSMAIPPLGKAPMTVMVHDLAWRSFPEAFPERGIRWHD